ncbi:hypothetical protein DFS34DRAFT_582092 [Phlyctochytrium arcticum]|nr:hypothetical protein DFS34DRAFT_582092 [Phlyctochytrium arcticum]
MAHLPIDTKILCQNILGRSDLIKTMCLDKELHWGNVFRVNSKAFKPRKGYRFAGRITTDCTSVTVYFEKDLYDKNGKPRKPTTKKKRKRESPNDHSAGGGLYFQDHLPNIKNKPNFVVADPNKRDLLYCRDPNGKQLRYTSMQRRLESGTKKYTRIIDKQRTEGGYAAWESMIPTFKTMQLDAYETYLQARCDLVPKLQPFYDLPMHNKFKWNRHINIQRSEQKFITNFRRKFGGEAVMIMGDWSDAGRTLRYQTSSKTAGWRKTFKQHKVDCYLIDEYRTSQRCATCEEKVSPMLYRQSPRPWIRKKASKWGSGGKTWREVHGLLCCNNINCTQQGCTIWNRDDMSTRNMLKIVEAILDGGERPANYRRDSNDKPS